MKPICGVGIWTSSYRSVSRGPTSTIGPGEGALTYTHIRALLQRNKPRLRAPHLQLSIKPLNRPLHRRQTPLRIRQPRIIPEPARTKAHKRIHQILHTERIDRQALEKVEPMSLYTPPIAVHKQYSVRT